MAHADVCSVDGSPEMAPFIRSGKTIGADSDSIGRERFHLDSGTRSDGDEDEVDIVVVMVVLWLVFAFFAVLVVRRKRMSVCLILHKHRRRRNNTELFVAPQSGSCLQQPWQQHHASIHVRTGI